MLDELSTPGLSEAQTPGIQAGKAGILNYIHPGRSAARIDAEDAGIQPISVTQRLSCPPKDTWEHYNLWVWLDLSSCLCLRNIRS